MVLKSLSMRVGIDLVAVEAVGCQVRIIIGYDRRPEGGTPTVSGS